MKKMFKVYNFNKLNSTNLRAQDFKENSVIIAKEQAKGKGRFKRAWNSSKGGIYMSIVLEKNNANYLTLIASIAAQKAIEDITGINTKIKWPNDLLYNKKKLCGILTKVKNKAIIGIGINTNNKLPKSLNKATSLSIVLNKKVNNYIIIKQILKHLKYYLNLLKNRKYYKIRDDWKKLSFLGSKIKVKTRNKTYSGTVIDIDKDCFLIIKSKGKKRRIIEGDMIL
jgi:BirA family biotin operon repressor/biotin-[acetyl-CoA-carboxylase] ligase